MLQHQTKIELKAEPTHDGTNDIIAAIIDKLGELTHGCAIITGCTMTIDWITGGTYQTHLEHVDIHDTCIDPDRTKRMENLRMEVTGWIDRYIDNFGHGYVLTPEVPDTLHTIMTEISGLTKFPQFSSYDRPDRAWTTEEFNWFCKGLNVKYRLIPSTIDGTNCFEFVDMTKKRDSEQ